MIELINGDVAHSHYQEKHSNSAETKTDPKKLLKSLDEKCRSVCYFFIKSPQFRSLFLQNLEVILQFQKKKVEFNETMTII